MRIIIGFLVFSIGYGAFIYWYSNNKNKKWLEENPTAVKVYMPTMSASGISVGTMEVESIDGEEPRFFTEGMKRGFYLLPGTHVITSTFTKTRPGVVHRSVSTVFGPTKQEVEVKAGESYYYDFDTKTNTYTFTKN